MRESVRNQYEAFPDPSLAAIPAGPNQLDRVDDSLHYGWSWMRYQYCYRKASGLRILDAGCGTGLTTLGLARLNPDSVVIGVDASPRALEAAEARARTAGIGGVEFRAHDLEETLPSSWGPFDFIVCRGVLGQAEDPVRILRNLAAVLDHRGLLHATFPSAYGRQAARQMRQAVDALAEPGMGLEERAALGLALFQALRPDHPIRRFEAAITGAGVPGLDHFIAGYLGAEERTWTLEEVGRLLDRADWRLLYAPPRWPWQPDRVLAPGAAPQSLQARVAQLSLRRLAELTDALDPALHLDEYRVYACLDEFEPLTPDWVEDSRDRPEEVDLLIPHLTGLARFVESAQPTAPGCAVYRTVGGARGEVDPRSHLLLRGVDGTRSCAQINQIVNDTTGVIEPPEARRDRWLELANKGFVTLEPPDPRQHIDCRHLGRTLDRLDCPCPRRWLRECELHGVCTIATVRPDDEKYPAWSAARQRLGAATVTFCSECPDYSPEN